MPATIQIPTNFCRHLEEADRVALWPMFDPALNPVGSRRVTRAGRSLLGQTVARHREGVAEYAAGGTGSFESQAAADAWVAGA